MSTSSEIGDSGDRMPDKSSFSHTFNLLSRYLKENGTLGDLSLGMATPATGSMNNLFPATKKSWVPEEDAVSASNQQEAPKSWLESAQMTIFYGGQVVVLDDFAAEKAMEIMMLAGKATFRPKEGLRLQSSVCHLPIARKASLARFLEKRKERITARSPYKGEIDPSKGDDSKAWLAFTAESSGQLS